MNDTTPLSFGPELIIAGAAAAHEALADALARGGDVHLALHQLVEFDSSGVQLLLALRRSLIERGDALRIDAVSDTVRDALRVFGLDGLLLTPVTEATR